jgi:hypothetical protein
MRTALIAVLSGFLGAWLFQLTRPEVSSEAFAAGAGPVAATRIDLVDSHGKLRAQFGFSKEGPPGLWFMDEKGVARIAMGLYPDGTSHFGLQDKDGNMIQLMRSIGASESPLLIFKNKGADRMILGLNSNVDPSFVSYDKNGKKKTVQGFADGP